MLARLQRFIVLALACAIGLILAWFASRNQVELGCAIGLLLLFAYAVLLGVEFILLRFVQQPFPVPPGTSGQLMRAWWGEVLRIPLVFFWLQPFRSNAEPDNVHPSARVARGVVLVHGYVCNRGLWNSWMRELRCRQAPFIAVNLEPVFGSINSYSRMIEDAVCRLEAVTGAPVVLVGHSMGGLAIRAWLQRFGADARVHRVITIGSPHHGTWLARFGHTTNGKQMRQNGRWLNQLAQNEPPHRIARFTCFYGHCDNIVFPVECGTLPGADNRHVAGTAHMHMVFRKAVFDEAWRWISGPADTSKITSAASIHPVA